MTGDPPFNSRSAYAAGVLLEHLAHLQAQIAGVRDGSDIEFVHQMRVASRRLRNAMDLFDSALPRKKSRRWRKQIKRVTKALGAARDLDVHIEFIAGYAADLKARRDTAHQAGVERLLLRLRQERVAIQPHVAATMDELEASGVLEQMRQELATMTAASRLHGESEPAGAVVDDARQVIALRLEQMLAYEPFIRSPEHVAELHQMRIAAKHLRYTLEAYRHAFEGQLKWQIRLVKQVQTQLGEIHDCDMWIERLPQFIADERRRHEAFFGHRRGFGRIESGIEHLHEERVSRRELLYQQFVALWDQQAAAGNWQNVLAHLAPMPMKEKSDEPPAEQEASPSGAALDSPPGGS